MAAFSTEVTPEKARDPERPTHPPLNCARASREAKSLLVLGVPHWSDNFPRSLYNTM